MKFLLDTHAFIWWGSDPTKLPSAVLALCQDSANILLVSIDSWLLRLK